MINLAQQSPSTVSLERLVPGALMDNDATGQETLELHLARYNFATRFINGGRVLDCACGVGYGTAILASAVKTPSSVLGVDIDPKAARYASENYASDNVSFRTGDGCELKDVEFFDS